MYADTKAITFPHFWSLKNWNKKSFFYLWRHFFTIMPCSYFEYWGRERWINEFMNLKLSCYIITHLTTVVFSLIDMNNSINIWQKQRWHVYLHHNSTSLKYLFCQPFTLAHPFCRAIYIPKEEIVKAEKLACHFNKHIPSIIIIII